MTGQLPDEPGEVLASGPVPPLQPQSATPSGYAIAAFVLGILSFVTCGPCAGLPAFILGLVELRNIRDKASPIEGKAFALAGTILGGISTALAMLVIMFYVGIIVIFVLAQGLFGFE
jgi:hypothetical protein